MIYAQNIKKNSQNSIMRTLKIWAEFLNIFSEYSWDQIKGVHTCNPTPEDAVRRIMKSTLTWDIKQDPVSGKTKTLTKEYVHDK